jgi:hypothetical protein
MEFWDWGGEISGWFSRGNFGMFVNALSTLIKVSEKKLRDEVSIN